ncbi:MAG TPA: penicillin-binding transpeptidase domain-containing protein, partial [Marinobacter sp.]|nr:penicillin-binding transpeptidase domain-containing protein [Marinobacter sp.]
APERWAELAQKLGWDKPELESRLARFNQREFMYLVRHLPPHEAAQLLAMDVPGVYSQREYRRYYPAGEVAAQLVGITDIDDRGQEGIELAYDAWLAGESGARQVIKDLRGRTVRDLGLMRSARSGRSVALSIDLRLQHLAHTELKKAVLESGAKGGSVVVLDVATGEVLAMANHPSYNPNDRSRMSPGNLRNRALTDVIEPGSTVKPLAVLAALEEGIYHPHSVIDTSPGWIHISGKTLKDPVDYGVLNLSGVIAKSSQVGMTKLALNTEPEVIRNMYYRMGLGQSTGTGFPGEALGVLPNYNRWQPIQRATYAFGYGINLTMLQLAQAYAVLASGGQKRPVSLLRTEGEITSEQVVSAQHTRAVMSMLSKVVSQDGTAINAQVESYSVAGKTGTVHKVGSEGYIDNRYIASFAGMAPAKNPRIVTVVMVDEPSEMRYFGGQVAAPVFSSITGGALRLLQEPPENKSGKIIVRKQHDNVVDSGGPLS